MKKTMFFVTVAFQFLILIYLVASRGMAVSGARRALVHAEATGLEAALKGSQLDIPIEISTLNSNELDHEDTTYAVGNTVYVKLDSDGDFYKASHFGLTKPESTDDGIVAVGMVAAVSKTKVSKLSYKVGSRAYTARFLGKLPKGTKKGKKVLVSLDPQNPGRIERVSKRQKMMDRALGRLVSVDKVPGKRLAYSLRVAFQVDEKEYTGAYTHIFYNENDAPAEGAPVGVTFQPDQGGYRVTWVDVNPPLPAKVRKIESVWNIQVDFGLTPHNLQPGQRDQLLAAAEQAPGAPLSAELAITGDGKALLVGVRIGSRSVAL